MTVDPSTLMSLSEAARRLGRSEQQIRTLCRRGELRDVKVLGRRMVERATVEHFAAPRTPTQLPQS
jgi:excisionase family DNA binding protein